MNEELLKRLNVVSKGRWGKPYSELTQLSSIEECEHEVFFQILQEFYSWIDEAGIAPVPLPHQKENG